MENQSMRRRQTVLGEQLPGANAFAQPRGKNVGGLSMPASAASARAAAANSSSSSLLHPNGSGNLSVGGASVSNSSLGLGARGASHRRSFSRMSARMAHDDSSFGGDAASVRSMALDDEDYDPELMAQAVDPVMYLSRNLAGATPNEVLRFGEVLKQQAQRVAEAEQFSMQRNQKLLTEIASNVARLAPAVTDLRSQVGDLSLVTDAMCQDVLAAQTDKRIATMWRQSLPMGLPEQNDNSDNGDEEEGDDVLRTNRRQSMYVLGAAWTQGLNRLYERVEGAQHAVPPAPDRHIKLEEPGWMEMNAVTQQPVRPVLLVLLNDVFLLAAQHQGHYRHEWHTGLDEPVGVAMDETHKFLKIAHLTLLAPNLQRLRAVYAEVCKLNELASASSSENRGFARSSSRIRPRRSQRRSRQNGHGRNPSNGAFGGSALGAESGHSRQVSHHSISSIPEITLEEKRDGARVLAEIDAAIAERRFQEAAHFCLENEEGEIISPLVQDRSQRLAELLLDQVRHFAQATIAELVGNMQLLIKLGRNQEARTVLLDAAAADIESQARQVHFMGDVSSYIAQMAAIYFQTINATITIYRKVFPKKVDSSVVVAWAKSQVDIYAAIFNRQLFRIGPEFQAYKWCREVSRLESSQLREQKINMDFMLRYVWES